MSSTTTSDMSHGNFNFEWMRWRSDLWNTAKWRQWMLLLCLWLKKKSESDFLLFCSDSRKIGYFRRRNLLRRKSFDLIFVLSRGIKVIHCYHFKIIWSYFCPSVPFVLNVTHDKSGKSDKNSAISSVPGLLWWNLWSENLADGLVLTRRTQGYVGKKVKWLLDNFSKIPPSLQKWVRGLLRKTTKSWYHEVLLFRDEKPVF